MRKRPLQAMFSAVPARYDLVNRVMTWGLDRRWRRLAARTCLAEHPARFLDLACGTGDLALTVSALSHESEVTAVDFSPPMLEAALTKAENNRTTFVCADAASLPFAAETFACIGTSFAFRNLTYRNPGTAGYLADILRVLGKGGRFVIVETSQPNNRLVRGLFHAYLRYFVRGVGAFLSGNRPAYSYLAESARRFYTAAELNRLLLDAGFSRVTSRNLLFGAVAIHTAVK